MRLHHKTGADQSVVGRISARSGCGDMFSALTAVADQGCTRVEIPLGLREYFDEADPSAISKLMTLIAERDVVPHSVHCNNQEGTDIGSPDLFERRGALAVHKFGIIIAADLGAKIFVLHPGRYGGQEGRSERIDIAADSVASLSQFAASSGVTIAVENMLGTIIGHHEDELFAIISRADPTNCGLCFDSGHANLQGRAPEIAAAMFPRTITTHLHDNNGLEDQHLFPGESTVPWRDIAEAFRESDCGAWLLVESNKGDYDQWQQAQQHVLRLLELI